MSNRALKLLAPANAAPINEELWQRLESRTSAIGIVGLGYVGLPLACHLAKDFKVIGFDTNKKRVAALKEGVDSTLEVEDPAMLRNEHLSYESDPQLMSQCEVLIVAVPTPVDSYNKPDLEPLIKASRAIGKHLKAGATVVYESTVFPGVTEGICRETLEAESGLVFNKDFFLGYSPERINPGDRLHTPDKIIKVVSGSNEETLELLSRIYSKMTRAGVHRAPSIMVAEACKITENIQRDTNIALINELTMLYDSMGISMYQVLEAAKTKWNFLNFYPGLVGGHCIGVDPYYLIHVAEKLKTSVPIVTHSRIVNEQMPKFLALKTVSAILKHSKLQTGLPLRIGILGAAFKENVPDIRNTKVVDLARELEKFGCEVLIVDAYADAEEFSHEYQRELTSFEMLPQCHAVVLAVRHEEFEKKFLGGSLKAKLKEPFVVIDFKEMLSPEQAETHGFKLVKL